MIQKYQIPNRHTDQIHDFKLKDSTMNYLMKIAKTLDGILGMMSALPNYHILLFIYILIWTRTESLTQDLCEY